MGLTEPQIRRFARHILLPEVGGRGQEALLASTVRVPGAGRAAEEAATYLVAGGVGRIIVDAALLARVGARLLALDPDADIVAAAETPWAAETVATDGAAAPPPLVLTRCVPEDDRTAGALAALAALVALSGAGPLHPYDTHGLEVTWTAP